MNAGFCSDKIKRTKWNEVLNEKIVFSLCGQGHVYISRRATLDNLTSIKIYLELNCYNVNTSYVFIQIAQLIEPVTRNETINTKFEFIKYSSTSE